MPSDLSVLGGATKLGFFASSLAVAALAGRLVTTDFSPTMVERSRASTPAGEPYGRTSDDALHRPFDTRNDALFGQIDPAPKPALSFGALHAFESAAPSLRLLGLTPSSAAAVKSGVPVLQASNPPGRPFVLTGSAADRANALICLTQAVYYEAGFEPGPGQQAVAQVVLNRMRHPIFPHSVCGVVYQGANLKTGCQFSFTCDGALNRKPQPAAWARAKAVAERALNGFVMKAVGSATHYHTHWVVPWWEPTVSKVAQIGAHVFYRWPGALGQPTAFTMRYAGNERIQALPNPAAPAAASSAPVRQGPDGRVHMVIQLAANTTSTPAPDAATPQQRMHALAAKGLLGKDFDPSTLAPSKVDVPSASHLEQVMLAAPEKPTPAGL